MKMLVNNSISSDSMFRLKCRKHSPLKCGKENIHEIKFVSQFDENNELVEHKKQFDQNVCSAL